MEKTGQKISPCNPKILNPYLTKEDELIIINHFSQRLKKFNGIFRLKP